MLGWEAECLHLATVRRRKEEVLSKERPVQPFLKALSCEPGFFQLTRADQSSVGTLVVLSLKASLASSGICVQRLGKMY